MRLVFEVETSNSAWFRVDYGPQPSNCLYTNVVRATLIKPVTMFEKLHSFFERKGFLVADEQFEFIKTLFIPKKVQKGEFLLLKARWLSTVCSLLPVVYEPIQ